MKLSPKKRSVLEILIEAGEDGLQFMSLFMTSPYGTSFNKFQKDLQNGKWTGEIFSGTVSEKERFKKRASALQKLIKRMEQEGLVECGSRLCITKKGRKRYKDLKSLSYNKGEMYPIIPANKIILFSFDIPETKRHYRNWLRSALTHLGFSMQHKSVWIGSNKLPKEFLKDIVEKKLMNYIVITEIGSEGSLRTKHRS